MPPFSNSKSIAMAFGGLLAAGQRAHAQSVNELIPQLLSDDADTRMDETGQRWGS